MIKELERLIDIFRTKLFLIINRAVIRSFEYSTPISKARIEALKDEQLKNIEYFQHFGFTSAPPEGSEAILLSPSGNRAGAIIIATENRTYRIKTLASGECIIYDKNGNYAHIKADKMLIHHSAEVEIDAPLTTCTGNLVVEGNAEIGGSCEIGGSLTVTGSISSTSGNIAAIAGNISDSTGSINSMRTVYNTHTHPENGDGGGTTSAPNQAM